MAPLPRRVAAAALVFSLAEAIGLSGHAAPSTFASLVARLSEPPGDYSTSVGQRVDDLLEGVASGRVRSYGDLVRER